MEGVLYFVLMALTVIPFMLIVCLVAQVLWLPVGLVLKIFIRRIQIFAPLTWWWYVILFGIINWCYKFLVRNGPNA